MIAGEESVSEEQYLCHTAGLRRPWKGKLSLGESGRTCKLAELFLDGTSLLMAVDALMATVSRCKGHS